MHNVNPTQGGAKLARALLPALLSAGSAVGAYALRRGKKRKRKRRRPRGSFDRDQLFRAPVSRGRIIRRGRLPSVRIKHREYLKDIDVTASTDARWVFPINAGMIFPWLSTIAMSFEKYRFHSLQFEYVTATATSTTGAIALVPEYDPDDQNTNLDKGSLYMFDGLVRGPLWESLRMAFRTNNKQYFTRDHSNEHESKKWHDLGQLIVDVTDPSVTATIGELWVEYDVELFIPQREEDQSTYATFTTTDSVEVTAGVNFCWGGVVQHIDGVEFLNHLYGAVNTHRCAVRFSRPGEYTLVLHAQGGTNVTAMDVPAIEATFAGSSTVTKVSQVISGATEITVMYNVHVSEEYSSYGMQRVRSSSAPCMVNLGTMAATAAPTSWTLTVRGA